MNAERLHAIACALNEEMTTKQVVPRLQELIDALQNVVNQSNPQTQQALVKSLDAMYAAVTDTQSDDFSPTWRQILCEIGGEGLFGANLKATIEDILARNQLTPAVGQKNLQELNKRVQSFKAALDQAVGAFREFKVGDEKLAPGECEIGILIPRLAVKNRLLDFSEELKELDFILNTFAEVATGKRDESSIKTLSSSELLVYLNADPTFAGCLAFAVVGIRRR